MIFEFSNPGSIVPGTVCAIALLLALYSFQMLPVNYAGDLDLTYDSCSVVGCRTEQFQSVVEVGPEPENKRLRLDLQAWLAGYSEKPFLDAGSGSIVRLFFAVAADALPGQQATISFSGYDSYQPRFYGTIYGFEHQYQPEVVDLALEIEFLCGDADGNLVVNVSDAVYLISYVFAAGPPPIPFDAGDANCDGVVNISDAVYLIAYIFSGGPAPCAECS